MWKVGSLPHRGNAGAFISSILLFKGMLPPRLSGPWKCQLLLYGPFACRELPAIGKGSSLPSQLPFTQPALCHFVTASEYSKNWIQKRTLSVIIMLRRNGFALYNLSKVSDLQNADFLSHLGTLSTVSFREGADCCFNEALWWL